MKKIILGCLAILFFTASVYAKSGKKNSSANKQKNVLFIAVDDLRLQAGVYGQEMMHTPGLDRLGEEGVVFNRAYCNVPVCGASRASLMSGVRPTNTRFINYHTKKDVDLPNVPSLAKWFKKHGYLTFSNGKIYHHTSDDLDAWSEKPFNPNRSKHGEKWGMYQKQESIDIIKKTKKRPAWEDADVDDTGYPEGLLAEKVIGDLKELSKQDKPFFMSIGFWKPHLPFNAPKKYWDLYKPEDIKLADNPYIPEGAPKQAMHTWGELRKYHDMPEKESMDDEDAKKLIHGYYASVSYTDAQIAKLLATLDELGIRENTVVILWGDHGWHLGEHTLWCKHCNFDRVMNAPIMVSAPGYSKGVKTNSITEFIDIYPSLCELCEVPLPGHLDGTSFVPALKNPKKSVKDYAYIRYHKGESIVSENFNYTEWYNYKIGKVDARMLYNLEKDPKENVNVSEEKAYKKTVSKMSSLLAKMRNQLSEKK
ncbi:MAG: sulfatase [Draconibacterium sp.]|nr:sulfatase [Draconibacterium sp.]